VLIELATIRYVNALKIRYYRRKQNGFTQHTEPSPVLCVAASSHTSIIIAHPPTECNTNFHNTV